MGGNDIIKCHQNDFDEYAIEMYGLFFGIWKSILTFVINW